MNNHVKTAIRLFISVVLISILLIKFDYSTSILLLKTAIPSFIIFSIIAVIGNILASAYRIKYLLKIYNLNASVMYLSKLYVVGNFYNNFLPTQMGGDVYKAVKLAKDLQESHNIKNDKNLKSEISANSIFVIFMDRFSGLIVLYLIGLVGLFINLGFIGLGFAILLLILSILGYFISIKLLAKKFKFINKFKEANKIFIKNKKQVGFVFITAFVVQIFAIFTQIFCFWALSINISAISAFLYIPIITILGLVPSINGLGVQDASYVFFFSKQAVTSESILAVSLLYHIIRFGTSLIGGVFVLRGK